MQAILFRTWQIRVIFTLAVVSFLSNVNPLDLVVVASYSFEGHLSLLCGGFNPVEKYARQNGNLPQIGVKIKNV